MPQSELKFSTNNQESLMEAALALTLSDGWMSDAHALGAYAGEHLVAVVVFQNITTLGAQAHFGAIDRKWMRRDLLRPFYKYAFDRKKFRTLTFPIAWSNVPAQIAALKSGALVSGIMGAGVIMRDDAITYTMTREMCRWLPHPLSAM